MPPSTEMIPVTELPETLFEDITQILHCYSTGIIKLTFDGRLQERAVLIGSGTFIAIESIHGILTAHHVAELLSGDCSLGLTLHTHEHKCTIDVRYLDIIEIERGPTKSEGPDLAFIVLPNSHIGRIEATKSFYHLSHKREKMLSKPPDFDRGLWFICGVPDEQTTEERSERGFDSLKGFHALYGATFVTRSYLHGEYDYFELKVRCGSDKGLPLTYGGVSGGGLWQVPLTRTEKGQILAKEYILSGVAFYESEMRDQMRFIKCHGRESIYKIVCDSIIENCF